MVISSPRTRAAGLVLAATLLSAACTDGGAEDETGTSPAASPVTAPTTGVQAAASRFRYPPPPEAPDAGVPSREETDAAIERLLASFGAGRLDAAAVDQIGATGDARHAWLLSDLLRFFGGDDAATVVGAFETVTGVSLADDPDLERNPWLAATNHMIVWDTPSYPGYPDDKAALLVLVEPRWEPLFDGATAIDWRYLNWGGVLIDDRPRGDDEPCRRGCIPALDDPEVTGAEDGGWYPDDAVVFGIVAGGEALAIPKHIAEVHEMFNLTVGGQRLGIPYCTLCGSAQAYRTDLEAGDVVLRTSGLLSRSNKVMFDLDTMSVFDTFTGEAVSGPLHEQGVVLEEVTVVRSTWGAWKEQHPNTTIIAEDGGIGRVYPADPLGGRDDDGPIFPVGAVDPRLPEQQLVVGVIAADGRAVAFPSDEASNALDHGEVPSAAGVEVLADGDGLRAVATESGEQLPAHEAFWFAWSQFHPDTELWMP
jgi:hypothetical protein